ncbi:MAG: glycosyltransferase family 39 protein [Candidatus Aminicenantes bacterium]
MDETSHHGLGKRIPAPVWLAAAFVLIATNVMSFTLFDHIPHVNDEIAYLFQAKIFASGKLYLGSPCSPRSFDFPHIINNGRWYSQYPPGFPLLLLPGVLLGVPWLINPLLAVLAVILLYKLGCELYGKREGLWAAILGAFSIWFLLISSTLLSHTSSILFVSVGVLFLLRSLRSPTFSNGLLAGLGLGMAFLIRPYNTALISIPLAAYVVFKSLREPAGRLKNLIGFSVAIGAAVLCLLLYNQATTGSALKMGYIEKYGPSHGLGFGKSGYMDTPHTPERALTMMAENAGALNAYLFGWPISSLLFIIPFLMPSRRDKSGWTGDRILVLSVASLASGLFLYWGTHVILGPRMYFEAFPFFVLMTARGLTKAPVFIAKAARASDERMIRRGLAAAVGILFVYAFLVTLPRWTSPPGTRDYFQLIAKDYMGVTTRIHRTIDCLPLDRSMIIMKFLFQPKMYFPDGWWGSGFLYNDPSLANRIIYAQDQGVANVDLLRCHPDRQAYLYVGTLERGMLVPIELRSGGLDYGDPVHAGHGRTSGVSLVASPDELYTAYSPPFRGFLRHLYSSRPPNEIDVSRLRQWAEQARREGRYMEGAYALEAALQVELSASVRSQLLGSLATLYLKTGEGRMAGRIGERLSDLYDPRVFDVFPERGF